MKLTVTREFPNVWAEYKYMAIPIYRVLPYPVISSIIILQASLNAALNETIRGLEQRIDELQLRVKD